MNLPDWRAISFDQGILAEPKSDRNRLVLWVPRDRDASFQHWERIGNVIRGEICVGAGGLCATAATSVPARQRLRGGLGQLFQGLRRSNKDRDFSLPDGSTCGAVRRATDRHALGLVARPGDPDRRGTDSIGLAAGEPVPEAGPEPAFWFRECNGPVAAVKLPAQPARATQAQGQATGNPREQAEVLVAAARQSGDRSRGSDGSYRPGGDSAQ